MSLKSPYVILLVGPPLSGKSTWIRNNYSDTLVISRDEIVMELYGSRDYNSAFDKVDQKEVDRLLRGRLLDASTQKKNVIIDMTNMTSKRRRANLSNFNGYHKVAVVFPFLSDDEYSIRNKKRIEEENKNIPLSIIKSMIQSYQQIQTDENFDEIINL